MKRVIHKPLVLAAILAAVAASPLGQVAYAGPAEPDVPGDIAVPGGHKLFLVGHAVGVQIYSCNVDGGSYAWGFVAPRAELYDDDGKLIATHFGGPSWQAKDGSLVVGRVDKRYPVAGTIPWLRLAAASTSAGPDGDRLAHTSYIQRIATTGGVAPAAGTCNADTVETIAEVPYTADYYFWKETGGA